MRLLIAFGNVLQSLHLLKVFLLLNIHALLVMTHRVGLIFVIAVSLVPVVVRLLLTVGAFLLCLELLQLIFVFGRVVHNVDVVLEIGVLPHFFEVRSNLE